MAVRVGQEVTHEGAAEAATEALAGHDQPLKRDAPRVLPGTNQDGRMTIPQRVDATAALAAAGRCSWPPASDRHVTEAAA